MEKLEFRTDYLNQLGPALVEQLIADTPYTTEEALTDVEATAISIIAGHLEHRYDLRGVFNARYRMTQRVIRDWAISLACYLLYERSKRLVPTEELCKSYNDCMLELRAIERGKKLLHAPPRRGEISDEANSEAGLYPGFEQDSFDMFEL